MSHSAVRCLGGWLGAFRGEVAVVAQEGEELVGGLRLGEVVASGGMDNIDGPKRRPARNTGM